MKRILAAAAVAVVAILVLFDVDIRPRFVMPHEEMRPDPGQEDRYTACVAEADHEIHAEVFANVDNPDVQRELLYRRKQAAEARCRERFPRQTVAVRVPMDINLLDLRWRY